MEMFLKRPATLMYLDPPYFADRTNGYSVDNFDINFHVRMLETASKSKCMIFISGYNNELYNSILTRTSGWTKRTIDTITKDISGNNHDRKEVVWTNQYFQKALKLNKLLLRLTKEELRANKLNPERK
jgi:DNA adenine methylase